MRASVRNRKRVEEDLAASRAARGVVKVEEFRGLQPGDPVRLKQAGTGQQILSFVCAFEEIDGSGVRWVDVRDNDLYKGDDGRLRNLGRLIPVKPDQVIKVRR